MAEATFITKYLKSSSDSIPIMVDKVLPVLPNTTVFNRALSVAWLKKVNGSTLSKHFVTIVCSLWP